MLRSAIPKVRLLARAFLPCHAGVSTLEFALILPIVMSIGLYGVEIVYLNTIDMKLSEMALSLADNASRLGQTDNSAVTPTVAERTDSFATTSVRDVTGRSGRFAGHQVDGRVRYWVVPGFLRSEVNALWLAKGRFLKSAPNAPRVGDTGYLSTSLIATF